MGRHVHYRALLRALPQDLTQANGHLRVRQALTSREEAFTSYRTPYYKLHLYETLTGYRFVLLSDASTDSLRFVLRQLYTGPFIDYVVRNPLVEMDSRTTGIDNDQVGRRRCWLSCH